MKSVTKQTPMVATTYTRISNGGGQFVGRTINCCCCWLRNFFLAFISFFLFFWFQLTHAAIVSICQALISILILEAERQSLEFMMRVSRLHPL